MYKLVNGKLEEAPKALRRNIDGKDYITTNPTEEMFLAQGYKYLEEQEKPEINENQALHQVFTETSNTIVRTWEIVDLPPAEEIEE